MKTLIQQYQNFNSLNQARLLKKSNVKLCWVPQEFPIPSKFIIKENIMKTLIQQYQNFNSINQARRLSDANVKLCWCPSGLSDSNNKKKRFCVPVVSR